MPIGLGVSLGVGGGKPSTSGGAPIPVATGFNIGINTLTEANILARTGDATGVIGLATDTFNVLVKSASGWRIYKNS